jgi:MFS family permease
MQELLPLREKGFLGYSSSFWLLCLASMFFFASFNMVIPEFPAFLEALGGADYKQWIIASFSLMALVSRPFSGKITDNIGRLPVMLFGAFICIISGVGYIYAGSVFIFFSIRAINGLAAGFTPTGNVAYIADIVHAERRGEAMGWIGISGNIGTAFGPAFGGWLASVYDAQAVFVASAVCAAFSFVVFTFMKETLPKAQRKKPGLYLLKVKVQDFWEPSVRRVSVVMALTVFSFGAILTVIPDFTLFLGYQNKGLFFTVFVLSSLIPRLLAGKASDHFGREPVVRVGVTLLAIAMFVLSQTHTPWMLMASAVLMGLAQGIISPTLFAWASDLAPAEGKGRSMATLYIALELGVTLGAYSSGSIFANKMDNLVYSFALCSVLAIIALLYLLLFKPKSYI